MNLIFPVLTVCVADCLKLVNCHLTELGNTETDDSDRIPVYLVNSYVTAVIFF